MDVSLGVPSAGNRQDRVVIASVRGGGVELAEATLVVEGTEESRCRKAASRR